MASKILALASQPIDGAALKEVVGDDVARDAEVLVIAPALNSKVRFWVSDPDPAIDRAQEVADRSVASMDAEGIDSVAETGESDPLLAVQDALATFDADEIVFFTHPEGDLNWLEEGVIDEARERFGRPVRHLEVSR